jgi:repressor LexA
VFAPYTQVPAGGRLTRGGTVDFSVKDLTKRQREIFEFISRYLSRHGYPPTVREIGKAVGLHSSSTVHAHLAKLETLGVLKRDPTKPRAMEVLVDKARKAVRQTGLPLVGQVAAGEPIVAEEHVEEYVQVPEMIGGEDGDYILRVRGESMIDAGILEGDFVVVRPAVDAADGEIVVAVIEEEATVKRFFREKDHIRLQPENKSMKPIRTREAAVCGRVVGVFRSVS